MSVCTNCKHNIVEPSVRAEWSWWHPLGRVSMVDTTMGPFGEMEVDQVDVAVPPDWAGPVVAYAPLHLCCFGMKVDVTLEQSSYVAKLVCVYEVQCAVDVRKQCHSAQQAGCASFAPPEMEYDGGRAGYLDNHRSAWVVGDDSCGSAKNARTLVALD